MKPRTLRFARRMLVVAAALPLMQLGPCKTAFGTTGLAVTNSLPTLAFNSFFSAALTTLLQALGTNLFSLTNQGGTGS